MTTAPAIAETASIEPEAVPAPNKAKPRICPECSSEFYPPAKGPGQHKRFCDTPCRVAWANREKAQGAVLITIAKLWRGSRGAGDVGKAAFGEMTSILDILIADDRDAGRLPLHGKELADFARDLLRDPYMDRKADKRTDKRIRKA